jgi:hypothetical protein
MISCFVRSEAVNERNYMKKLLNELLTELSELYGHLRLLSFNSSASRPYSQSNMKIIMSKDARQIVDWSFLTPALVESSATPRIQQNQF